MGFSTVAIALMLLATALPALAKCAGISTSDLVDRSDVIASGTLSGAELHQYGSLIIATGTLNADAFIKPPPVTRRSFTVFAIWPAGDELESENCLQVDLRQQQGIRALWFLNLRPGVLAEVGPPGHILNLADPKLLRDNANAIKRNLHTCKNQATAQRVIDFLMRESDRLREAKNN